MKEQALCSLLKLKAVVVAFKWQVMYIWFDYQRIKNVIKSNIADFYA